jgi:hypothetical protein
MVQKGSSMFARISNDTKIRAALAVVMVGWIVMASTIRTPALQPELVPMIMLVVGFSLLIGGLVLMMLAER